VRYGRDEQSTLGSVKFIRVPVDVRQTCPCYWNAPAGCAFRETVGRLFENQCFVDANYRLAFAGASVRWFRLGLSKLDFGAGYEIVSQREARQLCRIGHRAAVVRQPKRSTL
jgi:hypothetical protein